MSSQKQGLMAGVSFATTSGTDLLRNVRWTCVISKDAYQMQMRVCLPMDIPCQPW